MSAGGDAVAMQRAIMQGDSYPPPGVQDTPENRKLWEDIAGAIEKMPPGVVPDIPFDWVEMPDD